MSFGVLDYAVFGLYLLGVLAVGLYLSLRVKTSEDYFLAGRKLPFWAIGMSIVVTDIGATSMVGLAGEGYSFGLVAANFDWIGSFAAMVLASILFIPYFWRTGVTTIPEFLGRRYNPAVRGLHSAIWILILIFDVGVILNTVALLVDDLLGWPYWISIAVFGLIIGVYVVGAGLSAVVATDVIQLVVMFIGGFAVVGIGLYEVGGPSGLIEGIQAKGPKFSEHLELYRAPDGSTPYPWPGVLFGLGMVMATSYFAANQTIVQRCLGAKSEWDAKASMLLGAGLKLFIPILVVTPGLIAVVLFDEEPEQTDRVYPMLMARLLPTGMVGLMFAALVAAMMSTIDSILNATATLWTKDIYQAFIAPKASEKELLLSGRVVTFVVLLASAATAPLCQNFEGLYQFIQTLLSVVAGPTLAILLLGMFSRRPTAWGGFVGLLVGCIAAYVVGLDFIAKEIFSRADPFFAISFWAFVLTALVTVLVSAFTPGRDPKEIAPLLWSQEKAAEAEEEAA